MDPLIVGLIIAGVVILLVVLIFIIWWISAGNSLRRMTVKIDEAASGIDVALTKRFDLLTKMVATVKGAAKHEQETLAKVTEMRRPPASASMKEKSEFANQMGKAFDTINVVAEAYPDLKANQNFLNLQNTMVEVEEQLQGARRVYNSNVSTFNQNILVFPRSVIARRLGMTKRDFFEAEAAKRQDVNISF
ncbi:MAG: LemA family protein [Bacilli bacterium]|nr:LemA family protein [Bacilli bacterium]